jgi:hypothetical protein
VFAPDRLERREAAFPPYRSEQRQFPWIKPGSMARDAISALAATLRTVVGVDSKDPRSRLGKEKSAGPGRLNQARTFSCGALPDSRSGDAGRVSLAPRWQGTGTRIAEQRAEAQ